MCANQTLATLAIGCLLEVQPRGFKVMVFQSLIYEGDVISFHSPAYVMCVYRTGMYRGRGCSRAILRRCRLLSPGKSKHCNTQVIIAYSERP
jgi:hypothetical protein